MRARFFGPAASTAHVTERCSTRYADASARSTSTSATPTASTGSSPSTRASSSSSSTPPRSPRTTGRRRDPQTDFARQRQRHAQPARGDAAARPDATFVFTSTNKVYGDRPNRLPLVELETRLELPEDHRYYGGDRHDDVDRLARLHSLFGVSKAAADLLVQEYGRYFDMPTVCFRGGCLTGPNHAGAQLHGFLSYLMRCTVTGEPYTVFGYGGKQVRDNIHCADLVRAFAALPREPAAPPPSTTSAAGARATARCSRRSTLCEQIAGRELDWQLERRAADRRPPLVDQRPRRVPARLPGLGARATTSRRSCARSTTRNVERWERRRVKLSVVIPAHNEAGVDRRRPSRAWPPTLEREEIDYEILVVDDASTDGTRRRSSRARRATNPRVRCLRSHYPPRLRLRGARRARRASRATRSRS